MPLGRFHLILLALVALPGCDDPGGGRSPTRTDQLPPVTVATSVYPLALLMEELGGAAVRVRWASQRGQQMEGYGDRPDVPAYQPTGEELEVFRGAEFLVADGRVDRWALAGLSAQMVASPTAPVLQLHLLPTTELPGARGLGGASWLDPITLAEAARTAADRLALLRPEQSDYFNQNAERLAEQLQAMTEGMVPRWQRVAIVSAEPAPLLARLGIEPILVLPETADVVVSPPEQLGTSARAAGAQAVLLPSDWAESAREQWASRLGLPVAIYDARGTPDAADPRSRLAGLIRFNLSELARPAGTNGIRAPD